MKPKMGYCRECGNTEPIPIIKDLCNYHYWKGKKKPLQKKLYKIRPVTPKRAKQNREYSEIRKIFLLDNPYCQARIPGCTFMSTDVHHAKGREGSLLTDTRYFRSVYRSCHTIIENNGVFARENGFSISRLKNDI